MKKKQSAFYNFSYTGYEKLKKYALFFFYFNLNIQKTLMAIKRLTSVIDLVEPKDLGCS